MSHGKRYFADIFIFIKESYQALGGKLVELETQEENEFIKNDVMTLSSGGRYNC